MALQPNQSRYGAQGRTRDAVAFDQGLRSYMLKVYNYMGSALFLSGLVAAGVASSDQLFYAVFGTPLQWVVMLAPFGLIILLGARVHKMSLFSAQATFWVFAVLMGASLAMILRVYTGESVVRVFLITAASFGALSLFGYTTKKDLSGLGTFLFIGLIGLVIAMVVNIFLQSSGMQWIISVIGVLIFAGLTAYDTQKIKEMYHHADGSAVMGKKAIMGALRLYLDFLNMFLFMLHIFGGRD